MEGKGLSELCAEGLKENPYLISKFIQGDEETSTVFLKGLRAALIKHGSRAPDSPA